jgi:hypothetical protein
MNAWWCLCPWFADAKYMRNTEVLQWTCSERHFRARTNVEEEVNILEATLLERPRGLQLDRRDAPDKESLCQPPRIHGCVWEA